MATFIEDLRNNDLDGRIYVSEERYFSVNKVSNTTDSDNEIYWDVKMLIPGAGITPSTRMSLTACADCERVVEGTLEDSAQSSPSETGEAAE